MTEILEWLKTWLSMPNHTTLEGRVKQVLTNEEFIDMNSAKAKINGSEPEKNFI